MSNVAQRQAAAPATTESILQANGLLPDQADARRMMEAARLRLPLDSTSDQIWWALWRRATTARWEVFALADYVDPHQTIGANYGGPMPYGLADRVGQIQKIVPDADIKIHASYTDPWITVDGFIVGGWDRQTILL
ncbi:MAG: hypothetical protein RIQ56_932 [Candidatus Parcubacteria bacterium]|jgi:hypothetical protein